MRALLALSAVLVACGGTDTIPTDTGADDGGSTATDTASADCTAAVSSSTLSDGAQDVYYRAPVSVVFTADAHAQATFTLRDAAGGEIPANATWSGDGLRADLAPVLTPGSAHTFTVEVCGATTTASFTTSALGTPLTVAPADLVGRTYVFGLDAATITEPALLNNFRSMLTAPILLSVASADATSISWIGALGLRGTTAGTYDQADLPTWDFPAADFSTSPYFSASAASIVLSYPAGDIPVSDFHVAGVFAADGESLEEAVVTGFADMRNVVVSGQPVCTLLSGFGVPCAACDDGELSCLDIVAESIHASYVPGLVVEPVAATR